MIKIDKAFTDKYVRLANISERKRINFNFHKEASDTLQRMLNVLNENTYVQPHKHENPDKREAFIILTGKVLVVEFDDTGKITEHILLCRDTGNYACEISPRTWHTIICMENNSVLYELKDGPYIQEIDKQFAAWAPTEGDDRCATYNKTIIDRIFSV
jgi:cupin fold WbuC family metalloprotein